MITDYTHRPTGRGTEPGLRPRAAVSCKRCCKALALAITGGDEFQASLD